MKLLLATGLLLAGLTVQAQTAATAHAPDGHVIERVQSISIPPLTSAPFTAIVTTELTKLLPDGSKATVKNRRTIARDTSGRIFEERRQFTPTGDTVPTRIQVLQYLDPNRHERYDCNPEQKLCTVSTYARPALTKMPAGMTGAEACNCASTGMSMQREALGEKTVENIEVIVSREIVTIAAGVIGNEKAEPIVKEFWYAPRLGVNLIVKRFDPRSGIQNFQVDHISLSEPDARMFLPPADYQVIRPAERAAIR